MSVTKVSRFLFFLLKFDLRMKLKQIRKFNENCLDWEFKWKRIDFKSGGGGIFLWDV